MADSRNLPPAEEASVVHDDLTINEDEREEIEREIDALVSEGGRESSLSPEFLKPRRSGFGLPILVWVLAGAAFTAGFFYISNYFQVREESITLESRGYFSTEAQLIEEILRESEQRLAAKDQEIGQIQDRLAQLDAEKQSLEQNVEQEIAAREAELRSALEAELEAERARLAEAGESQAQIDARIDALAAEREAEVAAQLETFREAANEELAEVQEQLAAQEAQLQQTLAASREERERLANEAAEREAELRAQFSAEIAELEDAEQAALARIDELQELSERERLLADRVLGSFTVIVQDIEEGLSSDALSGLASLERLLLDEGVGSTVRQRRRQTELALVSTLRGLVQEVDVLRQNIAIRDITTTDDENTQIEQERAAQLISTAADTVALAENAREAGRFGEARSLYQQALATIPSLEKVYPGILDLESTRREIALQSAVGEAQTLLAEGSAQEAVERYLESVRTIAADDDDPLLEVATGIETAVRRTQLDLLESQGEIEDAYEADLAARDQRIAQLSRDISAAANARNSAVATTAALRSDLEEARAELETQRAVVSERNAQLTALRREITALEDDLARATSDLGAARTRSASLQESVAEAQERIGALEAEEATLRARVAALEQELAERPEIVVEPEEQNAAEQDDPELTAATREEIAELNRTIEELEGSLDETRTELSTSRATTDELRADVEEANAQIASLEERIAALQENRTTVVGEAETLQQELRAMEQRVAELESLEQDVNVLTSRYERSLTIAQERLETGDYGQARARILDPFGTDAARRLFPGFETTLASAHEGLVAQAEAMTTSEARADTLADVVGLTTQVQQNIGEPRESIGVQSYLNREPELRPVADELFEIVELSARAISAPDIEYRLLGSVSRVTGNLLVVERLVALAAELGDTIEVRRAPTLGQEVAIATGTILEVTDQRVVVSVSEIYELDTPPATRDLVYLAQE